MNQPIVKNISLDMTDPKPESQVSNNIEGVSNRSVQGNENSSILGNENIVVDGEFIKIENVFVNVNYEKETKQSKQLVSNKIRIQFIISGSFEEVDENQLRAIEAHLRKKGKDIELTIYKAEEGSIKITVDAKAETLELLKQLFESGELTELLEFPIEDVRILNEDVSNDNDSRVSVKNSSLQKIVKDRRSDLSEADLIKANQKMATAVATDAILEQFKTLSLLETVELVKQIEETFGVSAAAPVGVAEVTVSEGSEEQTEFNVVLESLTDESKKISVLKVVRAITGLGLKEAKDLVETAPKDVLTAVPKAAAEDVKKQLEEAGGKVSIK
jgi:large subunit ribosomal protein L7/L12